MTQGQNWFLDELADACAADGRYGSSSTPPRSPSPTRWARRSIR